MSYTLSRHGQLNYVHAYTPARRILRGRSTATPVETDSVRPVQLYLHSQESPDPGHLVQWTGQPDMFLKSGERVTSFDASRGHEHALASVETLTDHRKLAGIVLEISATQDKDRYVHAGVHSEHIVKDHTNILRVATNGCALAWVLDTHENMLNGLYTLFRNGTAVGQSVVRSLGDTHFTIEHLQNDQSDRITQLEDKFAELTG